MHSSACGIFLHNLGSQMEKPEHFKTGFLTDEFYSFRCKPFACGSIFREEYSGFSGKSFLIDVLEINTANRGIIL